MFHKASCLSHSLEEIQDSLVFRTRWSSGLVGLLWSSVVVSKLWGVWAHYPAAGWILLHEDEPEGGACIWRMEWCFSSVRVESENLFLYQDSLRYHSLPWSPPYIHLSVTDANLSLWFISKYFIRLPLWSSVFFWANFNCLLLSSPENRFRSCSLSKDTLQERFLWQDDCWLETCAVNLANLRCDEAASVSVHSLGRLQP